MNTAPDPYETLGVPRNATTDEVRKAAKRKSKTTHPDAGGTNEAFTAVRTALALLTDPAKRERYDQTGTTGDGRAGVDQDRAAAMVIIDQQLATIMGKFINGGMKAEDDPRQADMPAVITFLLCEEINQAKEGIRNGTKILKELRDIGRRFKRKAAADKALPDVIAQHFARNIEQAERQIAALREGNRIRELAINMLTYYSFEANQPAERRRERDDWQIVMFQIDGAGR